MAYPDRVCDQCGKTYVPLRSWQRFDTAACRDAYWQAVRELAKIANDNRLVTGHPRRLVAE